MALKDEYEFCCDDLPKRSFSFFRKKRTEFCDITFRVGGRSISAHRIILSAAIPVFYEVFSEVETADSETTETAFPDIDSDAFESLIEYAYNCKLKISMENVKMLLSGACTLQMDEVKNACCHFLIERLNSKNVLEIRNYSLNLDSPELTEKIDNFIVNNFSEIMMTEKFLNVSFSLLSKLICSDELNVKSEEIIFESSLKWVKHCPEERKDSLLDLLKSIRFPFLDARYIKNHVAKKELIRSSPPCRDLVQDAIFYHLLPEERKEICNFPTSPRRFFRDHQKTDVKENLSICILFQGKENVLHSLDLVNEEWHIGKINGKPVYFLYYDAVVALDKKMYCFQKDATQILNLETNRYSSCRGMQYPRIFTGAVAHKNKVFICGGVQGEKASNVVEHFDPQTEGFAKLRCMNTCREAPSVAVYNKYIYVLGGSNGMSYPDCENSVEKYNVKTGIWSTSSPMFTARAYFGSCTLKDKMYVCGGWKKNRWISTAEVFDFTTNEWKFIASMNNPMQRCKLISCCNKVYAFGDPSLETTNFAMEIYEETDKWRRGPSLVKKSTAVGAAVVALPPL